LGPKAPDLLGRRSELGFLGLDDVVEPPQVLDVLLLLLFETQAVELALVLAQDLVGLVELQLLAPLAVLVARFARRSLPEELVEGAKRLVDLLNLSGAETFKVVGADSCFDIGVRPEQRGLDLVPLKHAEVPFDLPEHRLVVLGDVALSEAVELLASFREEPLRIQEDLVFVDPDSLWALRGLPSLAELTEVEVLSAASNCCVSDPRYGHHLQSAPARVS